MPSLVRPGFTRFTVDLPNELHRQMKIRCATLVIDMSVLVRNLIEKHFEEIDRKSKK